LHFTDNPQDQYNTKTIVEKINAKEVFQKGSFPEYFEEVGGYKILPGDSYTLHPEFVNDYYRAQPLYYFKINGNKEPRKYITANRYNLPYTGLSKSYYELESEDNLFDLFFNRSNGFFYNKVNPQDPTDPIITREAVDLPADENNRVTVEDLFYTPPYLLKYELSQGKSSFSQNFVDPYVRVQAQQPEDPVLDCGAYTAGAQAIPGEQTDWLYACYARADNNTAAGRRYITYNIGPYADTLIKYFLDPKTDPELTKQLFGFTKIELEELYDAIRNGKPDTSNNPADAQKYEKVTGDSFRMLRDVFNTQFQGKIYIDAKTNKPIIRTSANTLSTMPYSEMINGLITYTSRGPVYYHHYIKIPNRIICYTYFTKTLTTDGDRSVYRYESDRQTLIVPIDVTGKIVPGTTTIRYWVRNPTSTDTEDKLSQQALSIRIVSVTYDKELNITKLRLDKPMTAPYLIGCTRVPDPRYGVVCGPRLYIDIDYNGYSFDMIEALQS
jgi:hypothetical protein